MTGRADRADTRPALVLSKYLPYRLSVASNKASGLIARAYQARFGLTIWEWRVIAVLGEGACGDVGEHLRGVVGDGDDRVAHRSEKKCCHPDPQD